MYMKVTHSVKRKQIKAIHIIKFQVISAEIEAIHTVKLHTKQKLK